METWLPPALVIALMLFVWRDLRREIADLRKDVRDLRNRVSRIEGRLDPAPRLPPDPK